MSIKIFLYFGLFIAAITALGFFTNLYTIMVCTERVEGVVRNVSKSFLGLEGTLQEVAYHVNDVGYTIKFSSDDETLIEAETVTVCYNPSNPQKSYILEDKPSFLLFLAFFAGACFFMLIGYGVPWAKEQSEEVSQLAIKTLFLIVGVVITTVSVIYMQHEKKLYRDCTSQMEGIITNEGCTVTNGKSSYRPRYAYTVEGNTYRYRSDILYGKRKFVEGQSITVKYSPDAPRRHYLPEEVTSPFTHWSLIALGLIFLIPAAIALIKQFFQ